MRADSRAESATDSLVLVEALDTDILRFLICGPADGGKSTLIGRLLWDSEAVPAERRAQPLNEGAGRQLPGGADLSMLLDRLGAECEQGIAINVGYRIFEAGGCRFAVADTPGDERYTHYMATAASSADLAQVVVDARHGILAQTQNHLAIVQMMGIRHIALIVNKMDLIDWDEARFHEIEAAATALVEETGNGQFAAIPVSALHGDNVCRRGGTADWYEGPTVIDHLITIEYRRGKPMDFRFPVAWINKISGDFCGYGGTVRGGKVHLGDRIRLWPGGAEAGIERIVTQDGDIDEAAYGDAVTLTLDRELDVSRGDMLTVADSAISVANQIQARLIWTGTERLVPGRSHIVRFETAETTGQVISVKYRFDVGNGAQLKARALDCNDIGVVTISFDKDMPFDSYTENRHTGSFVLIDRFSNATIAAGLIEYPLRRATNVVWHDLAIDKAVRADQKRQRPVCLWFTGLSGSGKSTVANMLDRRLVAENRHTYVLDGDNVRHGLNHDLGFTEGDRVENIRRMAEVAKLMVDAGLIVMVCAISPYRRDREMARSLFGDGEFVEVFVDTALEECERRDPKGLYAKARQGQIPNFTGISAPYELPQSPDVRLDGSRQADDLAEEILAFLDREPE